ncbi:MAG: UDP-N-acetylmuramoyl-L-alanyl-D-glutamate--2,6-diaminopimelate ligase [Bacteroidota bacterium]|nr:UDP-N-acetylmuramoyl-L-alanyl-D-glutamate--2,6-diaminopimelate ligase [Bacteroidota bacterium]
MKKLSDILYKVRLVEVSGPTSIQVNDICLDSRKVEPGCLFVAVRGTQVDGHDFITQAFQDGAVAVVCEEFPEFRSDEITYIKVFDSSQALGQIAANFYDHPSDKMRVIGVTGTNGKTTIATLLFNLFRSLGYKAGLISTVCNKIEDTEYPTTHTTPDAISLNQLFSEMVEQKCKYCFMEVSSHSIVQERIAGIQFAGGIFTNITHEHLDFHKTFDEYIKAKKRFFDELSPSAFALSNLDDKNGSVMIQNTRANRKFYSLKTLTDFRAKIIENRIDGLQLDIDEHDVWFRLVGNFNAYNLLAIYGAAVLLGEQPDAVLTAMSNLEAVEGRFDYIKSQAGIVGIVDYAHTPDALLNVLNTIENLRTGDEQVITVVGCGGDRDRTKRPIMARIAAEKSDRLILTSDNPRSEDPEAIITEMQQGIDAHLAKKTISIVNRREAIKTACALALPGDIILIAGKGHEKYQEIKGVRHHFDDKETLNEFLAIPEK